MPATVPVLVPLPLDAPFDYLIDGEPPEPGSFVAVPFGPRETIGVVWDHGGGRKVDAARLRPVAGRLAAPPMPQAIRRLVEHVAGETLAPLGSVLRMAMSVPAALDPPPARLGWRATGVEGGRMTPPRRRVLDALAAEGDMATADLGRRAGVGGSVVLGMARAGLIEAVELADGPGPRLPDPDSPGVVLSPPQAAAADRLRRSVRARAADVTLLEGVPGSGKTEVYFEAVAEALRCGRRVLVLLPEIALGAQWLDRFVRRFGAEPLIWHSGLTPAQRRRGWRQVAEGRVPVLVGARSALFLPMADLGVIVVDEEHDQSFKQGDGVLYHARDMALARARLEGCPLVLATATPALETAFHAGAIAGGPSALPGWRHLMLPSRHGGARMPAMRLVDLRREVPPRGGFLSPALRSALVETTAAGEQSLLFLNRRGYAPLTICRACGHRLQCPNCSAWLVAHRLKQRIVCHHCGYSAPQPEHCPSCGAVDRLAVSGPGVERVAEELRSFLPDARVALMTSDTITGAASVAELVHAMEARAVDVLIGTQIIAKGHHFPQLTLVGVVDADLGLGGGDLRASERTFQLLYQVAGRAGRESRPGRVLIQTHLPEHPVMQALARGDKDRFLSAELEERRLGGMPPFGRLAALILAGRDVEQVKTQARRLAQLAPREDSIQLWGPAPAPMSLLRGRWRERILIRADEGVDLPAWLRSWLTRVRLPGAVALQIDVDPYGFL
ncbi:MAG: primosomal protein N' [Geminicoccaceae bacterium]